MSGPSQPASELDHLFTRQRQAYAANPLPVVGQRLQWLKSLGELLLGEQETLIAAISQDFSNRSADETRLAELMPSLLGIKDARRHLKQWMKPSRRRVGLAFQPASARVVYQPLGVVGIIVPWNYPLFLAVGPMIGALAAGNRVMLKLSESTPATGELLKRLFARVFPEDLVAVVLGEAEVGMAFSSLPFDHLLFTGSTSVGRHVMRAAAENLTPVTLELGGKSPAIVSADVPLKDAAERIAFGKTLNAGQTCVAPDYVLVPHDRVEGFVEAYTQTVRAFYPTLADNPDYTAIINERQLARLNDYLEDARSKGARGDFAVRTGSGAAPAVQSAAGRQRRNERHARRNLRVRCCPSFPIPTSLRHWPTSTIVLGHWRYITLATIRASKSVCWNRRIPAAFA